MVCKPDLLHSPDIAFAGSTVHVACDEQRNKGKCSALRRTDSVKGGWHAGYVGGGFNSGNSYYNFVDQPQIYTPTAAVNNRWSGLLIGSGIDRGYHNGCTLIASAEVRAVLKMPHAVVVIVCTGQHTVLRPDARGLIPAGFAATFVTSPGGKWVAVYIHDSCDASSASSLHRPAAP